MRNAPIHGHLVPVGSHLGGYGGGELCWGGSSQCADFEGYRPTLFLFFLSASCVWVKMRSASLLLTLPCHLLCMMDSAPWKPQPKLNLFSLGCFLSVFYHSNRERTNTGGLLELTKDVCILWKDPTGLEHSDSESEGTAQFQVVTNLFRKSFHHHLPIQQSARLQI